jgi:hypothetical protein
MFRRLIILFLIVGCKVIFEPENERRDCFGVSGDYWPTGTELWGECYRIEETYGLNLQNQGLTGSIPVYIGQLYNLTNLNLSHNQITGEIPSTISGLTNLTALDLSNNQLTGDIPSSVCNLIESNDLNILHITSGNNLTNTCY